jgi:hypothetical protein
MESGQAIICKKRRKRLSFSPEKGWKVYPGFFCGARGDNTLQEPGVLFCQAKRQMAAFNAVALQGGMRVIEPQINWPEKDWAMSSDLAGISGEGPGLGTKRPGQHL